MHYLNFLKFSSIRGKRFEDEKFLFKLEGDVFIFQAFLGTHMNENCNTIFLQYVRIEDGVTARGMLVHNALKYVSRS